METCQKALFHYVLVLGVAIVGEGLDRNSPTRIEQAYDLKVSRVHQLYQVLHDDVDAVLMEVAVITEAEEIEFQALALHHQRAGNVINNKVSKIGLACLGAK